MANILVVHGSRMGQTEKIARRIAARLRTRGHQVELADAARPRPDLHVQEFHAICVGAPLYAGNYPRAIIQFVRRYRTWLQATPSSFFSVGLAVASRTTDGRAETRKCTDRLARKTGWRPQRIELFAGALLYTKYGVFIRWLMRRIAARAGGDTDVSRDYEYTDWAQVERFADEVAGCFAPAAAAAPAANEANVHAAR